MRDQVAVDSIAFARDAGELRATLKIPDLPRLRDLLFEQSGEIRYRLTGAVNKDGISSLRLELAADLLLTCQRCLGPVEFGLNASRSFVLIPPAEALGDPAEEPEDVERIHADAQLDVAALVEDETMLCLPMVARHPPGKCSPPLALGSESDKKSPFGALAVLKRQ
jgi:uncharacterized protein